MVVPNTKEMQYYLNRIFISPVDYKIIGNEIHINLNYQQIWYRQNARAEETGYIIMQDSNEYKIIHDKIFKNE